MMIDDEVTLLLDQAPEFTDRYLGLVEEADGDPGAAATFVELADYVAGLASTMSAGSTCGSVPGPGHSSTRASPTDIGGRFRGPRSGSQRPVKDGPTP
jgi:hypothetical protein